MTPATAQTAVRNLRPIYLIAEGLGFAEATNFAKFFRRETGLTPAAFRAENRG